ncbi:hypothetical protein N7507_010415 [Penicillium longicatenatum]|nr:hypothetical protein N7507_010415 [Penicillium longicatenatum]
MSNCIEKAQRDHQPSQESGSDCRNLDGTDQPVIITNAVVEKVVDTGEVPSKSPGLDPGLLSESPGSLQSSESREYQTPGHLVGHMIKDSYGCFRYIGGATNNMMIEAAESLSPGAATCNLDSPDDEDHVRLPFFIHGQVWPEISYLPQAKDLGRPPQYVSDLLIGIYFDQLHYTFPILYKPDFMRKHNQMTIDKRNAEADHRFLSVFFAVCACASSLLPRSPGSSSLPGIEYYQKALLLQFASTGEAFIEQVQCLGLLSLCSAGWNTLSQSWKLAGQAVRVAQDLGLHVSNLKWHPTELQDLAGYIEAQTARCVWWSVFGLDCLISLCLGRPMSTNEYDCCCDLPVDLSNEDLERFGVPAPGDPASFATTAVTSSPLTGFLAFTRLCKIATRVHRMHSSNRTRGDDVPAHDWTHLQPTVDILIRELDEWLQALPNDIRFSANVAQNGPNLTMCVIVFILHSATIMNLYR